MSPGIKANSDDRHARDRIRSRGKKENAGAKNGRKLIGAAKSPWERLSSKYANDGGR